MADALKKLTSRATLMAAGANALLGGAVENTLRAPLAGLPLGGGDIARVMGAAYVSIVTGRSLAHWMDGKNLQMAFMDELMCYPCLASAGVFALIRLARGPGSPGPLAILPSLGAIDQTVAAVTGPTQQGVMLRTAAITAASMVLGSMLWEAVTEEPDAATTE